MTTHEIRKDLGNLTQAEFADMFNIPLRTVQNWDHRSCVPSYIVTMLAKIVAYEGMLQASHSWDYHWDDNAEQHE